MCKNQCNYGDNKVLHGIILGWFGEVLYGILWYCMVLYGIVWYCMVLFGIGWYGMMWGVMLWDGMGWYDNVLNGGWFESLI